MLPIAKGKAGTDARPAVSAPLGDGEEEGMAPTTALGSCGDLQPSGMGAVGCSCPGVS